MTDDHDRTKRQDRRRERPQHRWCREDQRDTHHRRGAGRARVSGPGPPQPRRVRGDVPRGAGTITVVIDGAEHRLGPGEACCTLRGQVHGFRNDSGAEAVFYAIAAPGVFGWPYFEELAAVFDAAGAGPPDRSALGEIMRRHGLTPAPPPSSAPS